ncbi:hypothetical protein SmJEL517_g01937 [Synchytrium microbalum]|uniref:DNA-3-methyladenine glycosylase I n=1 Tax=Synchytrium microbalum TaxID=1806994 RepID=A0A507CCJ3_9FUNG|nr:uncharacterized protein SmJEL517_g01937 [Synchytrium microbalum]TPX35756.1 hypothetical protein SmJEL517_g01937 [Synchytrium microbalum]
MMLGRHNSKLVHQLPQSNDTLKRIKEAPSVNAIVTLPRSSSTTTTPNRPPPLPDKDITLPRTTSRGVSAASYGKPLVKSSSKSGSAAPTSITDLSIQDCMDMMRKLTELQLTKILGEITAKYPEARGILRTRYRESLQNPQSISQFRAAVVELVHDFDTASSKDQTPERAHDTVEKWIDLLLAACEHAALPQFKILVTVTSQLSRTLTPSSPLYKIKGQVIAEKLFVCLERSWKYVKRKEAVVEYVFALKMAVNTLGEHCIVVPEWLRKLEYLDIVEDEAESLREDEYEVLPRIRHRNDADDEREELSDVEQEDDWRPIHNMPASKKPKSPPNPTAYATSRPKRSSKPTETAEIETPTQTSTTESPTKGTIHTDGKQRCSWLAKSVANPDTPYSKLELEYHDNEWCPAVPSREDDYLFEFLVLEGAQAGLSWSTILQKRQHYKKAFKNFDVALVAKLDTAYTNSLLSPDHGLVKHKGKIEGAVANAILFQNVQAEFGSFAAYLDSFFEADDDGAVRFERPSCLGKGDKIQAKSELSEAISADLKKRGFKFVGPTIVYAYLQAVGIAKDHEYDCWKHPRHSTPT